MNLRRVADGFYLHVPQHMGGQDRTWLKPGSIVDLDDPFTAEHIKGQEFKLDAGPAPETAKGPTTVTDPRMIHLRDRWTGAAKARADAEAPEAKAAELATGIPAPDERPRKPKAVPA